MPLVVSTAALMAAPIAILVLRDKPEDVGLRASAHRRATPHRRPPANPIRTAFAGLAFISRLGGFWLLFGGFLVCGVSTNGLIQTHFISAAHDHEISRPASAAMLSAIGLFDIVGTIASGWLTDRYDPRKLLGAYYAFRGLSLLVLDSALASGQPADVGLHRLLRAGLGGHGAPDGQALRGGVRSGACDCRLWLGVRRPPDRRRTGGVGRRLPA